MATGHTANYQLCLWDASDTFSRTEFNENTQKIDTMYGPQNRPWVFGSYVGTTLQAGDIQNVVLGFRPSLLIVVGSGAFGVAARYTNATGQASTVDFQNNTNISSTELTLTSNGFRLTRFANTGPTIAQVNEKYVYFALR